MILAKTLGGLGAGMGGTGSGNWYRFDTKSTVEESLTLSISEFRGRIYPDATGSFTWTWVSGRQASVSYSIAWGESGRSPALVLHYGWRNGDEVRIWVRLQTTRTQFGGRRWWFTCPLIVGGVACNRRIGKLHLPPGARYFGCRTCHGLTYRSCQQAHLEERLIGRLGMDLGGDPELGRLLAKRMSGKQLH